VKPSLIIGFIVGYVLGSRAGRQRYEEIVAISRRIAGSQTVQTTAGVLQAQATYLVGRAKHKVSATIGHKAKMPVSANGHSHH